MKPIIKMIREEQIKEAGQEKEQGVLLHGLRELMDSNTENMRYLAMPASCLAPGPPKPADPIGRVDLLRIHS